MTIAVPRAALGSLAALLLVEVAGAQTTPPQQTTPSQPMPAPTPVQPPQTIPGLENFSLPSSRPTSFPPPLVTPTPTPSPRATPSLSAPLRSSAPPTPAPTPVPAPPPVRLRPPPVAAPPAGSSPVPASTPSPSASPIPAPSPAASSPAPITSPTSARQPAPTPAATAESRPSRPWLPWAIGAGLLALAAWWLLSRRRQPAEEVDEQPTDAIPPPPPLPKFLDSQLSPTQPVGPAPRLLIGLRPIRAGLNLLTATAECEIAIANAGDAPADAIRLDIALVSAHAGQDADLAAVMARPIGRPAVPPFSLAPGEERRVRAVGTLPRNAIRQLKEGDAPLFVPIAAVRLHHRSGDVERRTSAAFAIGIERPGAAKLAPFRLDQPPRLYDQVAARRHMSLADG